MNIKKSIIPLTLLIGLGLLVACDGDDDPSNAERISKTWRVSRVLIDGTEDIGTNYGSYRFTFNSNGNYSFNNPDSESGSWVFNSTETQVILNQDSANQRTLTIIELTDNSLIIEDILPSTFKDSQRTIRFELVP